MTRLRLPPSSLGREYLAIPLYVQGQGPFEFMVDSGLSTELITPHLQQVLESYSAGDKKKPRMVQGIAAGGVNMAALTELSGVSLPVSNDKASSPSSAIPLPVLHAVVTDFPQEHLDPAHDPIEGMIGMEFLSLFDVEFDFPRNRLRLYKPGTAPKAGLVEIPAAVINDTGLLAIRVVTAGQQPQQQQQQPILGILDCGSTFSAVNWAATPYLQLPSQANDPIYSNALAVSAVGLDGKPMVMPTVKTRLSFCGNVQVDPTTRQATGFAPPPAGFEPWQAVPLAVGNLPAFAAALGDGVTPYTGPAALIGLDILAQRRFILESTTSRQRRVWMSPK